MRATGPTFQIGEPPANGLDTILPTKLLVPGGNGNNATMQVRRFMRMPAGHGVAKRLVLATFCYDNANWHAGGLPEFKVTTDYYVGGMSRSMLVCGYSVGAPKLELIERAGPHVVTAKLSAPYASGVAGTSMVVDVYIDVPPYFGAGIELDVAGWADRTGMAFTNVGQYKIDGTLSDISDPGPSTEQVPGTVPWGGTTDQMLAKASAANHDLKWVTAAAGGAISAAAFRYDVFSASASVWTALSATGCNTFTHIPIPDSPAAVVDPAGTFTRNTDGTVSPTEAGWYVVEAEVQFSTGTAMRCYINLDDQAGGSIAGIAPFAYVGSQGSIYPNLQASATVKLTAGQKVYVNATSETANQAAVERFTMHRIGGTQGPKGDTGSGSIITKTPYYQVSGISADRVINGGATSLNEIVSVLGTLINDLRDAGVISEFP